MSQRNILDHHDPEYDERDFVERDDIIDFAVEKSLRQTEGKKLELWFARDKDGCLYMYLEKPKRIESMGVFGYIEGIKIQSYFLPQLTWEDEPVLYSLELPAGE